MRWGHVKVNYNTNCELSSYRSTVVICRLSYSGTNLAPIHQYLCCPRESQWYIVSRRFIYSYIVVIFTLLVTEARLLAICFRVGPFWAYWTFCNSTILNSFVFHFHVWRICLTSIYHVIYLFKPRSFVPSNSFVDSFRRFPLATRVTSVAVDPCVLW